MPGVQHEEPDVNRTDTDWRNLAEHVRSGGGEAPLETWLALLQARRDAGALPEGISTAACFSLAIELVIGITTRDRKMGRRFEAILHALSDRKLSSRRDRAVRKLARALREANEPGAAEMLEGNPAEFMNLFSRGRAVTPVRRAELFEALLVDEGS